MLAPAFWRSTHPAARVAQRLLWPPSAVYGWAVAVRGAAYRYRLLAQHRLPVPVVAVGGLSVGGAGKTPVASWIADYYAQRRRRVGVVLRGVGGDEAAVHQLRVPAAIVVEDPDRPRGCRRAVAAGAEVLVLDDGFQRLDVERDLNIAVIAAESADATGLLPSGPWREPWTALRRADVIVITRKSASPDQVERAARLAGAVSQRAVVAQAALGISGLTSLRTRVATPLSLLRDRRTLVSAGIADPWSLAAQLAVIGARPHLWPWPDHHAFTPDDVARLASAARTFDYVVVTEKDAVKLGGLWPSGPEPLVATLDLTWDRGQPAVETLLSHFMTLS